MVLVEEVAPAAITTINNAPLLDTIRHSLRQMEAQIHDVRFAMNNEDVTGMGSQAGNMINTSLKISDLILLLKTDEKQNLYILAAGLKNLSETLYDLTRKGIAAKADMGQCIRKTETKFSTLSTGIRLVQ